MKLPLSREERETLEVLIIDLETALGGLKNFGDISSILQDIRIDAISILEENMVQSQ